MVPNVAKPRAMPMPNPMSCPHRRHVSVNAPIALGLAGWLRRCVTRPRAQLLIQFVRCTLTLIPEFQMTFARICIALAVIASWSFSGQAAAQPKEADIDAANRLFQTGKFAKAGEIYARTAAQDPKDYVVILQLGRIALLSNRLDVSSNKLLVSQYPTLDVAKLESFKGQTPYEVQGDGQTTRLKFLKTDPLPLVSVRVNGGDDVTFFIDTGGSEVALDTEFAKELGLPHFGEVQGT